MARYSAFQEIDLLQGRSNGSNFQYAASSAHELHRVDVVVLCKSVDCRSNPVGSIGASTSEHYCGVGPHVDDDLALTS